MGANPTGRAGRHGHLVVELRIRGELTAAVSRSATEAVESHGTRLISPCRGLGTNSKFEVVIPPRILSAGAERGAALVGAHQGIVDEVLGQGLVARQRKGIPAHWRQLPDHVVPALVRLRPVHNPHTELTANLIPQRAIDDALPQLKSRTNGCPTCFVR